MGLGHPACRTQAFGVVAGACLCRPGRSFGPSGPVCGEDCQLVCRPGRQHRDDVRPVPPYGHHRCDPLCRRGTCGGCGTPLLPSPCRAEGRRHDRTGRSRNQGGRSRGCRHRSGPVSSGRHRPCRGRRARRGSVDGDHVHAMHRTARARAHRLPGGRLALLE